MPTGRQFRRPSLGRSRRLTEWGPGPLASGIAVTSGSQLLWTAGSTVVDKVTIVRIRGLVEIQLHTAAAVGDGFFGAVGFAIVSNEAFAAGAGSVPSPFTSPEFGWLWHSYFSVRAISATIADGVNAVAAVQRIEIDNKSMRKQSTSETLVGVIDQEELGTATAELNANCRILDKLS